MIQIFASTLFGFMSTIAVNVWGGDTMPNQNAFTIILPDFRTAPSEQLSRDVNQVVDANRQIIASLIAQLRDGNLSNEGKVYVIYLLGQLRGPEAVTILLENIHLKALKVDPKIAIGRWGIYPAQEALSKIGTPAVHMILDKLPTETDELRRKLMCFVIAEVQGKGFGQLLIKHKRDQESDASRRTNLEAALKVFDMID